MGETERRNINRGNWPILPLFHSSTLPSFHLKWSGPLRLQSPRSAFADTPIRRYADTPARCPLRLQLRHAM